MITHIQSVEAVDLSVWYFCVVEEDKNYPGQLVFQAMDQAPFTKEYSVFLTRFNVLRDTGLWGEFVKQLEHDGYTIYILPSAEKVLDEFKILSMDLKIDNFHIPNGDLFSYQKYGMRAAIRKIDRERKKSLFFFNWGTGSGKGMAAVAMAQELFNRGDIDFAILCTVSNLKINLTRRFESLSKLQVRQIEGTKQARTRAYQNRNFDVLVMNYERMHFDYDVLADVLGGQRVLFLFDEVQKILTVSPTTQKPNQARSAADRLIDATRQAIVYPMSASVIKQSPERYWRTFDFLDVNPLGTLKDFRRRYLSYTKPSSSKKMPNGKYVTMPQTDVWDLEKLEEIPHRIAPWTHSVRKDDPGVRELFKETQFVSMPVQMTAYDRKLYDLVKDYDHPDVMALQRVSALQYVCNTAESFLHTDNELAKSIVKNEKGMRFSSETSAKMEALVDLVERIRDQGDQVVVFTHWTNLSLFPIAREFNRVGIRYVLHCGEQSQKANQKAQDDFFNDSTETVFLTSDAGAHGLSFQNAKYVINYECPYSYDDLMQRNSRIDRADSYLDGLMFYVLYNEDTVEERIWAINDYRRRMAAATQGTTESLDRSTVTDKFSDRQLREGSLKFILGEEK